MQVRKAIEKGKERLEKEMDPREAERCIRSLLQELRAYSSSDLIINKEEELKPEEEKWLEKALARLEKGEPLQYVLGHEEFYGLELKCDPRALIPRPETEELVEKAVQSLKSPPERILDLGTGNGCIALALKKAYPGAEIHALDSSEDALALAGENVERTGLDVILHKDELDPTGLSGSLTFDLVVSNPPYVAREEREGLAERVREHEPDKALFVREGDALGGYRSVLKAFARTGRMGGLLWMELNPLHADRVLALMKEYGLETGRIVEDLSGKRRFANCQLPLANSA